MKQKRIAAIHDISGFGKCSLTVALPIISAAGVEAAVIPTSVLSTHTAGFEGYTFLDLTDEIMKIARHWHKVGIHFDAIYTGFLGSIRQIDIVSDIINLIKSDDTVVIVDPAMADNGSLYPCFDKEFSLCMKKLCSMADIIVPNITEAVLMLEREYKKGPYTESYITELMDGLKKMGAKNVVLTGVYYNEKTLGAAVSTADGSTYYTYHDKIEPSYHGTGDVFASAFVGALMNGKTIEQSASVAVNFTCAAILKTIENNPENKYGVNFEQAIPEYIKTLKLQ